METNYSVSIQDYKRLNEIKNRVVRDMLFLADATEQNTEYRYDYASFCVLDYILSEALEVMESLVEDADYEEGEDELDY